MNEGPIRKGGLNEAPKTPRPDVTPVPQQEAYHPPPTGENLRDQLEKVEARAKEGWENYCMTYGHVQELKREIAVLKAKLSTHREHSIEELIQRIAALGAFKEAAHGTTANADRIKKLEESKKLWRSRCELVEAERASMAERIKQLEARQSNKNLHDAWARAEKAEADLKEMLGPCSPCRRAEARADKLKAQLAHYETEEEIQELLR